MLPVLVQRPTRGDSDVTVYEVSEVEMCASCGFVMEQVVGIDRPPRENDISCCAGCGFPYALHEQKWIPFTLDDIVRLTKPELERLVLLRAAIIHAARSRPPETPPRFLS